MVNDQQQAVLGDFGISRIDSDCFSMTSSMSLGCTRWLAPEIMFPAEGSKPQASWASDMWAFGMVALELFTESLPFAHLATDPAVVIDIHNGRHPDRPTTAQTMGPGLCDKVWSCVQRCWERSPSDRPLASDIVRELQSLPNYIKGGSYSLCTANKACSLKCIRPTSLSRSLRIILNKPHIISCDQT